jgi:hypothetical protein
MSKRRGPSKVKRVSILIDLLYLIYPPSKQALFIGRHRVHRRRVNKGELRGIATRINASLAVRVGSCATASETEVHVRVKVGSL